MHNYYYLVSGLTEYHINTDTKFPDAAALREEIAAGLTKHDAAALRELYTYYDISNIINMSKGRNAFDKLGNFSKDALESELEEPADLPDYIAAILKAYKYADEDDKESLGIDETIDTTIPVERNLWSGFYAACARSDNRFIREWYAFDLESRNISTAYTARLKCLDIESSLISELDIIPALTKNTAPDFGLKNEIDYIERLIQILDTHNMLEKERRLDLMRWEKIEELTQNDYFNINRILGYCAMINIIHRWISLNKDTGREMLKKLIAELSDRNILEKAVSEQTDN